MENQGENILYQPNEESNSVYSILEYTANDGKIYKTKFYNLDAILSVGYRVNSKNATLFRQWANQVLKEYLLKGYSINVRFEQLEERVAKTEEKIDFFVRTSLPPVEGIFFNGQINAILYRVIKMPAYVNLMRFNTICRKTIILIKYICKSQCQISEIILLATKNY